MHDKQRKEAYRALLNGVWGGTVRGLGPSRPPSVNSCDGNWPTPAPRTRCSRPRGRSASAPPRATGCTTSRPALCCRTLRFAEADSPFHDDRLDPLCGASHGDLHGRNALFPCSRNGEVQVKKFCLVDTDRFADDAPLTRDQATLLLDAVRPDVADRRRSADTDALRDLLIDPEGRPSDGLSARQVKVIKASYDVGLTVAKPRNWGRTGGPSTCSPCSARR
ncbi:hypothetical protein NKG94_28295 [Micromonospora sp. M12]